MTMKANNHDDLPRLVGYAYETQSEVIVTGYPPVYDGSVPAEEQHSCDEMGCGSLGQHVLHRFQKRRP